MRITRLLSAFLTATLLSSHLSADVDDSVTVNEILRKHFEAMGGPTNWNYVESIRLSGTVEREDETYDLVIVKKRPDQIRATVTMPLPGSEDTQVQLIRAHDGDHAWMATRIAGDPDLTRTALTEGEAEELLADAGVLPPLVKHWRNGREIRLVGTTEINGEPTYQLQVNEEEAPSEDLCYYYISTDSYLLIGSEITAGDSTTRTVFSGYQARNGVYLPTLSVMSNSATGESKVRTESIQVGVGIYDDYFADSSY